MEIIKTENLPVEDSVVTNVPEIDTAPKSPMFSRGIVMGFGIALVLMTGVAGFYAGRYMKTNAPMVTPTPTPTVTELITPTVTETPTETIVPTGTATPTPTVSTTKKTAKIKEFAGDYTLKFTVEVPSDVTLSETKVGPWNGILLRKGTKAFMAFNLPYELFEQQGYSSVTNVVSTNIAKLKRVRAKKVFDNSGSYKFAVAYVTSTMSGGDCTGESIGNVTTSPCAMPITIYGSEVGGFGAYCSVDPTYIAICDKVMKTIVVVKE